LNPEVTLKFGMAGDGRRGHADRMRARATSAPIQKNSASDNKVTKAIRLCIISATPILEGGLDDRYGHAAKDGRSCGDCVEPSP